MNPEPPEGGGPSRSWIPRLKNESWSSKLRHDATAAATLFSGWIESMVYTGTFCGMNMRKSAQLKVLGHLHGHRARRKRKKWQKGSRVARGRGRAVPSRFIAAVRAQAATGSSNGVSLSATRIEHQPSADLVPKDPKPAERRGWQASELRAIVAVDYQRNASL